MFFSDTDCSELVKVYFISNFRTEIKNPVILKDHVEYEGYLRYSQREYFGGLRKLSTVSPQRQRDHSKTDLLSAQGA